jgi:hypothetical protein
LRLADVGLGEFFRKTTELLCEEGARMKRSFGICRDRCGDKCHQLFTSEPADKRGEWYSDIGTSGNPGRPASIYLPRSVALFLVGQELQPGERLEAPFEAFATDSSPNLAYQRRV